MLYKKRYGWARRKTELVTTLPLPYTNIIPHTITLHYTKNHLLKNHISLRYTYFPHITKKQPIQNSLKVI